MVDNANTLSCCMAYACASAWVLKPGMPLSPRICACLPVAYATVYVPVVLPTTGGSANYGPYLEFGVSAIAGSPDLRECL